MRLIDADRMKFVLDKNFGGTSGAAILTHLIDMQPTAYDVDAVIKELDDYAMWKEFMIYDLTYRERLILDKVVEIVKRGGQDER